MKEKRHLLVIDPTAFAGGSKVATENILRLLDDERVRITVVTADRQSWRIPGINRFRLYQPIWLARQEQGIPYFLRHLVIVLNLLLARLRYGRFDTALGASGPGVDLALYLAKPLLGFGIVQLIHGPVACSRTIGRCLDRADQVYFLESTRDSVQAALSKVSTQLLHRHPHYHVMKNGLPQEAWPSRCQYERPVIFWAASLLKWKGLDLLLEALSRMGASDRPETHICYIRPEDTVLAVSQAPVSMMHAVHWYEAPGCLDVLRASANIFVSTSDNEPFGLSILEAMAAGHCVLIPEDNAYWDKTLSDGVNCIKYKPKDAGDLAEKLRLLSGDLSKVRTVGAAAAWVADGYRAETRYEAVKRALEGDVTSQISVVDSSENTGVSP